MTDVTIFGQCGEEPGKILCTAVKPVVRDADAPLDRLPGVGASARQVRDQLVESRPYYSRP